MFEAFVTATDFGSVEPLSVSLFDRHVSSPETSVTSVIAAAAAAAAEAEAAAAAAAAAAAEAEAAYCQ
jgi:hypothetical protein